MPPKTAEVSRPGTYDLHVMVERMSINEVKTTLLKAGLSDGGDEDKIRMRLHSHYDREHRKRKQELKRTEASACGPLARIAAH